MWAIVDQKICIPAENMLVVAGRLVSGFHQCTEIEFFGYFCVQQHFTLT